MDFGQAEGVAEDTGQGHEARKPTHVGVRIKRHMPCCGSYTADILCCALDPRQKRSGKPGRLSGNWCCWCGGTVPEGRSYCDQHCSYSYHQDVVADAARKKT